MKYYHIFIAVLIATVLPLALNAQQASVRSTVIVDSFTRDRDASSSLSAQARAAVMDGLVERNRFDIIDANTDASIKALISKKEDVVTTSNVLASSEADLKKASGAQYVLSGYIDLASTRKKTDKDTGKVSYKTSITIKLSMRNLETGEVFGEESIYVAPLFSDDLQKEAEAHAIKNIRPKVISYVNDNYKFVTELLQLESTTKSGKLKEVYIGCGTNLGTVKGDCFVVAYQQEGNENLTGIGMLRVTEVEGDDISRCAVTSGGKEIAKAYNEGWKLSVVSGGKSFGSTIGSKAADFFN